MGAGLTRRRRSTPTRQPAPGRTRVLAVGIDDYDGDCGFEPLATGRNDALGLADCFRDVPQLEADPGDVKTLVSGESRRSRSPEARYASSAMGSTMPRR